MVEDFSSDDPRVIDDLSSEEIEKSIEEIVAKNDETPKDKFLGFFKKFFKE